jgi:hypothetical protein
MPSKKPDAFIPAAMPTRLAGVLFACLAAAACASRIASDTTRQKWCGVGGGAAYGAIIPVAVGANAQASGIVLGIMLAPVGAVVGAVDGAVSNPCPEAHAEPAKVEPDATPAEPGETLPPRY